MADTVQTNWIYPQAWDGELHDKGGFRRVVFQCLCSSDGTGETDIVKLDLSSLQKQDGTVPTRTVIEKIEYNVYGMAVNIEWDRAPRRVIAYLSPDSEGKIDWTRRGGLVDPSDGLDDRTGDIIFSTVGADSGDTYDVTMTVRLK